MCVFVCLLVVRKRPCSSRSAVVRSHIRESTLQATFRAWCLCVTAGLQPEKHTWIVRIYVCMYVCMCVCPGQHQGMMIVCYCRTPTRQTYANCQNMFVYVCMYACMYVRYVCMYVCVSVCGMCFFYREWRGFIRQEDCILSYVDIPVQRHTVLSTSTRSNSEVYVFWEDVWALSFYSPKLRW